MTGGILVATDMSARTDRAVERALLLGHHLQVPVTVLHVLEKGHELSGAEEQELRALVQREFDLANQNTEICFASGPVPPTIAKVAEERGCSLIVTGVARYNSFRDFLLGTAVDYLVRKSSLPILVVKRRARCPYDRLVVATDFSEAATDAILAAAKLFPDAQIRLVHAYEAAFQAFLEHDTTAPLIRDESERAMSSLVSELPEAVVSRVETVVQEGRTAAVLSKNISPLGNELLVLGTWHRRGHAHFLGGEDTWHLPSSEPCDVLVVKQAGVGALEGGDRRGRRD